MVLNVLIDVNKAWELYENTLVWRRHYVLKKIYRFVKKVYEYNYHNSGHYPSSYLLFKTQLNSMFIRTSQETHNISPTNPSG
jgi:hypothetical protein